MNFIKFTDTTLSDFLNALANCDTLSHISSEEGVTKDILQPLIEFLKGSSLIKKVRCFTEGGNQYVEVLQWGKEQILYYLLTQISGKCILHPIEEDTIGKHITPGEAQAAAQPSGSDTEYSSWGDSSESEHRHLHQRQKRKIKRRQIMLPQRHKETSDESTDDEAEQHPIRPRGARGKSQAPKERHMRVQDSETDVGISMTSPGEESGFTTDDTGTKERSDGALEYYTHRLRKGIHEASVKLPKRDFSKQFTHEQGGVLQKPGSDVVLTVPKGAVPQGKVYTITGMIHTNLDEFSHHIEPDEGIVGPVVELAIEEGGMFAIPVEIRIPHCVLPEEAHAIRVMHGTEGNFKEVNLDDGISYETKDQSVHISTSHLSFWSLFKEKNNRIDQVLLTVSAPKIWQLDTINVELRLMLHMECSILNDFKEKRLENYADDAEEITSVKIQSPENQRDIPMIDLELNIPPKSSWKIIAPSYQMGDVNVSEKRMKVTIEGCNVLRVKHKGYGSEHLKNFILENESDKSPLSCFLNYIFEYKVRTVSDYLHVQWPRTNKGISTPKQSSSEEAAALPETVMGSSVKAASAPESRQQTQTSTYAELPEDLDEMFRNKITIFKKLIVDADFILELYEKRVITSSMQEAYGVANRGNTDKVMDLMTLHLPKRDRRSKVLFLKCIWSTEQTNILEEIGLSQAQIQYIKNYK